MKRRRTSPPLVLESRTLHCYERMPEPLSEQSLIREAMDGMWGDVLREMLLILLS